MDQLGYRQSDIRTTNQKIIYSLLYEQGPLSRAEIAERIHSSKPTVSKNVDELIQEGKIIEIGKGDNSVGKKAILLDIKEDAAYVLALDMSKNYFRIRLSHLRFGIIDSKDVSMNTYKIHPEKPIASELDNFLNRNKALLNQVRSVVVAYPGVTGKDSQLYYTHRKDNEVIYEALKVVVERWDLPLPIVKNDINLSVLAENEWGNHQATEHLCLMSCDQGVGVGMIIHGKLYEGDRNAAGEISFLLPSRHTDGKMYNLEERISVPVLMKEYQKIIGSEATFEDLCYAVREGQKEASLLYERVLGDLSLAVLNLCAVLDMELFLLDGSLFRLHPDMIQELNQRVNRWTPFTTRIEPTIIEHKALKGAMKLGVDHIMNSF